MNSLIDYKHLLDKYDDMVLIATLILPDHTEAVLSEIGKSMNIPIDFVKLSAAVESLDYVGKNKVCIFEREREFVYIDCHKPQDLHQLIIRCLNIEKEKIYGSIDKWIRLRQEAYDQPSVTEIGDWMHPDEKHKKVKSPLLSSLKFNGLIIDEKNII